MTGEGGEERRGEATQSAFYLARHSRAASVRPVQEHTADIRGQEGEGEGVIEEWGGGGGKRGTGLSWKLLSEAHSWSPWKPVH